MFVKYQLIGQVDFFLVNRMPKTGIFFEGNHSMHFCQDILCGVYSFNGYMKIGVAGADKNRGFLKISFVIVAVDLLPR